MAMSECPVQARGVWGGRQSATAENNNGKETREYQNMYIYLLP